MKTEPRIDPLFKLTNKKAIVVDELLDGRTKGLIDEPEEQGYIGAKYFIYQPNVRHLPSLTPFNNCTVVRSQWEKPRKDCSFKNSHILSATTLTAKTSGKDQCQGQGRR